MSGYTNERLELPREDLLAEATALDIRVALAISGWSEPVVVGFRAGGAASVYFGSDPAYHFDSQGRLRRAYVGGRLFKAESQRLVALDRRRTAGQVQLLRHELTDDETGHFLDEAVRNLTALREQLAADPPPVLGEVSPDGRAVDRVRQWLAALALPPAIAERPHVR